MAIGRDGVTQMGLEDLSLMRSLPNMIVFNPATYSETKEVVKYLCNNTLKNPCYLRLGRQPVVDSLNDYYKQNKYEFAKGIIVKDGKDMTIFSTGCILPDVIQAGELLEQKYNISIRIVNFHTLKPIDKELIIKCATETNNIVTVEDHSVIGGIGSIISEVLCEYCPRKVLKIGLNDTFPESGSPADLYEKYGLSVNKIFERIENEFLGK
jgi:transketolase